MICAQLKAENVLAGFEDDEDAFRALGSLYTSAGFSDVCPTLDSSSFLPPHARIILQTARKRKIGPIIKQMIIERSPAANEASLLKLPSIKLTLGTKYFLDRYYVGNRKPPKRVLL